MCPNKINSIKELEEAFCRVGGLVIDWECQKKFFKAVKKLEKSGLNKFLKQVEKIFNNPKIGKYLYANRKGQRELYVDNSFRLYYNYCEKDNKIVFLEFSHKKAQ